ncbi:uncharacterized protein [Watersipora subatra]|uniref:uncharacterized protein n=1 Tax=Watersipora subatra TaxID=2589382 RepID=UPI00355B292A
MAEVTATAPCALFLLVIYIQGAHFSHIDIKSTHLTSIHHTSSNYRHHLQPRNREDSRLASILIPNYDNKLETHRLYESHKVKDRYRRQTVSENVSISIDNRRHDRLANGQHRLFQELMDKRSALNSTRNGTATIYMEPNLLPRYECPVGQWVCPKPKKRKEVMCIHESQVCDFQPDCPKAEDEDFLFCACYNEKRKLSQEYERLRRSLEQLQSLVEERGRDDSRMQCQISKLDFQLRYHRHEQNDDTGTMVRLPPASSCNTGQG